MGARGVGHGGAARRASSVLAAVAIGLLASAAHGQPAYSRYERETIDAAKTELHAEVDPEPEGKIIEAVVLRPLEVFEERDPMPTVLLDFVNAFHATSRPPMIRRELLIHPGDRWDAALIDESARNLRSVRQLSLVLLVPLVGSAPDRVKLLVITKDIWSLRLNSDFRIANGELEELLIAPSEENLAGLHHSVGLRFELEPDTLTFGGSYKVPRISTSRLQAYVAANVIVGRDSGEVEGTSGQFAYGQPLWSTQAEWEYVTTIRWLKEKTRYFSGLEPLVYEPTSTPEDDRIPIRWDTDELAAAFAFTRSFGSRVKHDLSFGVEASRAVYRPFDLARYAPAARREFVDRQVPSSDTRVYPYVGYATYSTSFSSYVDMNTLSLQEDYREGHDLYVKTYPVLEAFGSTRSFLGNAAGAAYTVRLGDGLARAWAEGLVEAAPEGVFDATIKGGLRVASPLFGFGRLVADGLAVARPANDLNRRSTLGGDTRLRGYASGAYRGEDLVAFNLELRTRPVDILSVQLAAASFFDAGAAFDHDASPDLRQSVGTGIRIVFPQLERTVMRVDWAVPLETDPNPRAGAETILPGRFVVTFSQAFGMPSIAPPSVLD